MARALAWAAPHHPCPTAPPRGAPVPETPTSAPATDRTADHATDVRTARGNGLGDVLRRSAARHPGKPAIVDGATTLTYRELDAMVDAVAWSLERDGIGVGDRVALLSRNSWQFAALAWGAARRGAVLVPVNFMLTAPEVAFLLGDAEVSLAFAQDAFAGVMGEALETAGLADAAPLVTIGEGAGEARSFDRWLEDAPAGWEAPYVDDDAPVRIMYTSGTESRPKGAMLSSRSLVAEYTSCIVDGGMSADDVDLHTLPLYHCAQLDCFLGPDLMLGATSIILPAPDPAAVLAAIAEHGVTKYFAPPTVWISLLRSPDLDRTDTSSLRKGYYGASPMPVEVLRELLERLPGVDLWNFYGQTEIAPVATILPPHEQLEAAGSAGRPVLNVETRVVDDEGRPVPVGEVGEIVHRTPQATLGYWRNPEKTAEAFRGGWFHSGDLGILDEHGRLSVVDRKKDMIKSGGENVASREVEEALYLHPDVSEVAVFGIADPKWIEAVVAAVVLKDGSTATAADLVEHCRARLAAYKCPKRIELREALPKNPSGKILKRVLREEITG
ncbi:long-chain-fatty-acid--CoA ligase [Nocardioides sp. zg-579]|uniref:Long-chain-fatty-acid--CoA ligase n=1 Tax=Nocardioides marmotae TaxID=2663857 RepID=A0A6I3IWR8_9ACTN|nr:long-chain-fatty-acid--CoA ligase [Gordonia jinghuaiqii]MTB93507.1 long-chain-fatty-acid--CoA ligase [Nocardioides marmotae]QKE03266.1 long-chain-fatty-acid--CoA ligase [Nocardioides marmotae]